MICEIGLTQTTGNGNFNKDLSQKRAQATRDYFFRARNFTKTNFAKGYGESVLNCKMYNESCTEESDSTEEVNLSLKLVKKNPIL
jgi:outer membrane protein OmpA-like peptidoglycan-associated protein